MAEDVISVDGISAHGIHGANPDESTQAQEFRVDVEVTVGVSEDSLDGTIDYRRIVDVVRETVSSTSFVLLESLAEAVGIALFEQPEVLDATVVVHKPGAAASLGVTDISATAFYPPLGEDEE